MKIIRSFLRKRSIAYQIFLYISLNQNGELLFQNQIANYFNKPLTSINYHILKFRQEGLLNRYLELTPKGSFLFKALFFNMNNSKLRAHNIQIKFEVVRCPNPFPDCFSKNVYKLITNKKYTGLKHCVDGITFMFYSPKKIICVMKDIYANNDEEISSAIQVLIPKIQSLLEKEFQGIRIGGHELAKIQTMHVAALNSIIATNFLMKGFTREDKNIAVDNSNHVPEIEITNPTIALMEIANLLKIEDKLKVGKKK